MSYFRELACKFSLLIACLFLAFGALGALAVASCQFFGKELADGSMDYLNSYAVVLIYFIVGVVAAVIAYALEDKSENKTSGLAGKKSG